jgi:hypothetical protein
MRGHYPRRAGIFADHGRGDNDLEKIYLYPEARALFSRRPAYKFQPPAPLSFDVTSDGRRFLIIVPPEQERLRLTVVSNWHPAVR